jgi:hypothetical protein
MWLQWLQKKIQSEKISAWQVPHDHPHRKTLSIRQVGFFAVHSGYSKIRMH